MSGKSEKRAQESEAAFAAAVALLNVLVLAAAVGIVWLLLTLLKANGPFNLILKEIAWR